MNIYNPGNLKNKQRFPVAIAVGLATAILCAFLVALVEHATSWYFSIVYIGAGYAIGSAIKYFGRGVEQKFSILAIICFIISVYLSDFFSLSLYLNTFSLSFLTVSLQRTTESFMQFDASSIMRSLFIIYSCYIAYYVAKIV